MLRIQLQTDASQSRRLAALQHAFAQVCNAIAPMAQQTACWNRVALHHMVYKGMRQRFPGLGSQMVCNAIYSVSRACRTIYQHPNSVFNHQRLAQAGRPLPQIRFLAEAPVYFDRHTLSIKDGQISMFTLDGRMRFQLPLKPADERRFRDDKLREIVLTGVSGRYQLSFVFAPPSDVEEGTSKLPRESDPADLPEYLVVVEDGSPVPVADPSSAPVHQVHL